MSSQGVAQVWVYWDLGVSRRDIQNKLNCWLANQHWARWRGFGNTQRQARELICGASLGAKTKVMSFNRTQSRAVIGLLTGHNTLWWHLYLLGLQDILLRRKCGVMEETSAHIDMDMSYTRVLHMKVAYRVPHKRRHAFYVTRPLLCARTTCYVTVITHARCYARA
jgi:hypothetical protein